MSRLSLAVIAVSLLALSGMQVFAQSPDPIMGTWSLKQGSFTPPNGASADAMDQPQIETMVYQPAANGFRWVVDSNSVQGRRTHSEVEAKLDGADYPVRRFDNDLSVTRGFRRLAARTYAEVTKIHGTVTFTRVVEISPDGKSLTTVDIATNNSAGAVQVFEKQ